MQLDDFIQQVAAGLTTQAAAEFGQLERLTLRRAMEKVGLTDYPEVVGPPNGERASGYCLCEQCTHTYFEHPMDWRVIDYGHVPFLHILCDGRRVKL